MPKVNPSILRRARGTAGLSIEDAAEKLGIGGARRSDDHDLRERIKALAHERRRAGYQRLHVHIEREGYSVQTTRSSSGSIGRRS